MRRGRRALARRPLTTRGVASLAVAAVVDLVIALGVPVPPQAEKAIVGLVVAAALAYTVVSGRRKVTPVADPRDKDGTRLTRPPAPSALVNPRPRQAGTDVSPPPPGRDPDRE